MGAPDHLRAAPAGPYTLKDEFGRGGLGRGPMPLDALGKRPDTKHRRPCQAL